MGALLVLKVTHCIANVTREPEKCRMHSG